ncbi:unnamed protein product, partial [Candidula unifasciata]
MMCFITVEYIVLSFCVSSVFQLGFLLLLWGSKFTLFEKMFVKCQYSLCLQLLVCVCIRKQYICPSGDNKKWQQSN